MISIHNHLGEALESADYAANLDEHAKELLADKSILAEIILCICTMRRMLKLRKSGFSSALFRHPDPPPIKSLPRLADQHCRPTACGVRLT